MRQATPDQDNPFCFGSQGSDDPSEDADTSGAEECNDECKDVLTPLARDRVSQRLKLADDLTPKSSAKQQTAGRSTQTLKLADPFCFTPKASTRQQDGTSIATRAAPVPHTLPIAARAPS